MQPILVTVGESEVPRLLKKYRFGVSERKISLEQLAGGSALRLIKEALQNPAACLVDLTDPTAAQKHPKPVSELLQELARALQRQELYFDALLLSPQAMNQNMQIDQPFLAEGVSIRVFRSDAEERAGDSRYRDTGIADQVYSAQRLLRFAKLMRARHSLGQSEFDRFRKIRALVRAEVKSSWATPGEQECAIEDGIINAAYVLKQPESRTLTVYFNGAIDPRRAKGRPVFQRRTWWPKVGGSHLSIADPTQALHPELALGWGSGSIESWGILDQAAVAQGFIDSWKLWCGATNAQDCRIRIYGSSGGGFQALAAGTFVEAHEVIANNPQVDWTRYEYRSHVEAVASNVYGDSVATVAERFPERINLTKLWSKAGYAPTFDLLVNGASGADVSRHTAVILDWLKVPQNASSVANSSVRFYYSPADGHNPLLPEEAFALLGRNSKL